MLWVNPNQRWIGTMPNAYGHRSPQGKRKLSPTAERRLEEARAAIADFPCPEGVEISVRWGGSLEPMAYRERGVCPIIKRDTTPEEFESGRFKGCKKYYRTAIRSMRGELAIDCLKAWMAGVLAGPGASPADYEFDSPLVFRGPRAIEVRSMFKRVREAFREGTAWRRVYGAEFGFDPAEDK